METFLQANFYFDAFGALEEELFPCCCFVLEGLANCLDSQGNFNVLRREAVLDSFIDNEATVLKLP
jgi:hypothetical protein